MIMTHPSGTSVKESTIPLRHYSDLPPSYDAAQAEPDGFIDGHPASEYPFQDPPEPLVTGDPPHEHPLPQNDVARRDGETASLYFDPTSGEAHITYVPPNNLLAQCTRDGHIQKVKYGTLSIFAAALFFPWGLLCLIGSRTVYCERCGLVLRAPGCKDCGSRPTYYSGKRRTRC